MTEWKEIAKANAANSGSVRKDGEKRMALNSGCGNRPLGNRLLAVTDDAEGAAMIGLNDAPFKKGGGQHL